MESLLSISENFPKKGCFSPHENEVEHLLQTEFS